MLKKTLKNERMTDSNQDDNLTLQREELEALSSIYGDDFTLEEEDPPTFTVAISSLARTTAGETEAASSSSEIGRNASLMVTFESGYPTKAPPIFNLSMPWIRGAQKLAVIAELEQLYLDHIGESIVYLWVEKLREILDKDSTSTTEVNDSALPLSQGFSQLQLGESDSQSQHMNETGNVIQKFKGAQSQFSAIKKFTIFTGEPFTDRKSTFQAHLATINDPALVRTVLEELCKNKKIKTATHNMYAYRICNEENNSFLQDCDDDGEDHAGSRLLHLLQILDAKNVLVVVTRWFGGIQLHADRFKHINNVARQLLEQQGFIQAKLSKK